MPALRVYLPSVAPVDMVATRGTLGKRSEEHTSELQSQSNLVCRLLLEKKKNTEHAHSTYTDLRRRLVLGNDVLPLLSAYRVSAWHTIMETTLHDYSLSGVYYA